MIKLMLIGNLTRDPELRTTPGGVSVCDFTIAVNGKKKEDESQFFKVTAWRGLGESCAKYLSKGKKVFVTGPVSARSYKTNNGETRVSLEVTADDVEFLTSRDAEAVYQHQERQAIQNEPKMVAVQTEELPF